MYNIYMWIINHVIIPNIHLKTLFIAMAAGPPPHPRAHRCLHTAPIAPSPRSWLTLDTQHLSGVQSLLGGIIQKIVRLWHG